MNRVLSLIPQILFLCICLNPTSQAHAMGKVNSKKWSFAYAGDLRDQLMLKYAKDCKVNVRPDPETLFTAVTPEKDRAFPLRLKACKKSFLRLQIIENRMISEGWLQRTGLVQYVEVKEDKIVPLEREKESDFSIVLRKSRTMASSK